MKTKLYPTVAFYAASITLLIISFAFFSTDFHIKQAHADSTVTLTIKYANDTSKSTQVSVNNGEKYTLSEEYSWVRDQTSRYNLQAYSIDNGPYVNIPRVARGNFTLDISTESNHEVIFLSVIQYPIETIGTDLVSFVPPSPTNDNWFDINSDEEISVPYVIQSDEKDTRIQFKGWSYDGEDTKQIERLESGIFNTPQIHMSNSHSVNFVYMTQYYLNLVSEYGHTTGEGWYDSGTTATIYSSSDNGFPTRHVFTGWNGPVSDPKKQTTSILMGGPVTITANWTVDYTPMMILSALVGGVGVIIAYKKRKMPPSKKILPTKQENSTEDTKTESKPVDTVSPTTPDRISDDAYTKEMEDYILQKSLARLELFETSSILSKEKNAKIKEKMTKGESDW